MTSLSYIHFSYSPQPSNNVSFRFFLHDDDYFSCVQVNIEYLHRVVYFNISSRLAYSHLLRVDAFLSVQKKTSSQDVRIRKCASILILVIAMDLFNVTTPAKYFIRSATLDLNGTILSRIAINHVVPLAPGRIRNM